MPKKLRCKLELIAENAEIAKIKHLLEPNIEVQKMNY
jgi:hypothetical protein